MEKSTEFYQKFSTTEGGGADVVTGARGSCVIQQNRYEILSSEGGKGEWEKKEEKNAFPLSPAQVEQLVSFPPPKTKAGPAVVDMIIFPEPVDREQNSVLFSFFFFCFILHLLVVPILTRMTNLHPLILKTQKNLKQPN